jgi:SAM-dependent methyltransferase
MWRLLPYLVWLKWHSIDVRGASVKELALEADRSHNHSNSGGPYLAKVLKSCKISSGDSVLDFGCGKGGAMITLAQARFGRVDGVELSPALAEIARKNLKKLHISNAAVYSCDAAELTELDEYDYFYMYNPFPQVVLERVLENIKVSALRRPRRITLIAKNPIYEELLLAAGFQAIESFNHDDPPFAVYRF